MATISLTARLTATDTFTVDIEDDETVESLSVIIYSLRPELGEDMRLVFKGRLLKPEQVISQVGLKSGDHIAVAKAPAKTPKSADTPTATSAETDSISAASTAASAAPSPSPPATSATSAPPVSEVAESASQPAAVTEPPENEEAKLDPDAKAKPQPPAQKEAACAADAEEQPQPQETAVESQPEQPLVLPLEPAEENSAEPQPEEPPPSADQAPAIDGSSAAGLRELADLLERGASTLPPEKLAEALRETASKMMALENAVSEFGQALHVVNMLSANTLRNAFNPEKGEGSGTKSVLDSLPGAQEKQEETRSFLHKKGDSDLHAMHVAAATPSLTRQTTPGSSSGISGSGSCGSPQSKPLTKEEMDKARQARLAVLEAKQAEKKKEKEEAEEREKSREALFNRPFTGAAKPLGQQHD